MNKKIIDVSKWNAIIDFSHITESADGVIVRAGFRGNTNAVLNADSRFLPYMEELNKFEVPLGAYFITSAINSNEAIEEANFFIDLIEQSGIRLSIPIFVRSGYTTTSHNGRSDNLSAETRTTVVKAFIEQCKARNYNCGLYTKRSWINDKFIESELTDIFLWLESDTIYYSTEQNRSLKISLLKYDNKYTIKGISGTVDFSIGDIDSITPYIVYEEEIIKEEAIDTEEDKFEEEEKIMITKAECKLNKMIKLDEAHLYKTSISSTIEDVLTGKYYIANEKILRGRVRISNKKNGEIIGWINVH